MSKRYLALRFTLVLIIVSTVPTIIYYNIENIILSERITEFQQELTTLKTANLTACLGVTKIPTTSRFWATRIDTYGLLGGFLILAESKHQMQG